MAGAAFANAAIDGFAYAVNCGIEGEKVDTVELLFTVSASALTSGKGIDGASLRGVYKYSTETLKTAVSPKKIGMYTAKKKNVIITVLDEVGASLLGGAEDGLYRDIERRLGW